MFIVTINNKSERNYRGKCIGWPVTSYGGEVPSLLFGYLILPEASDITF